MMTTPHALLSCGSPDYDDDGDDGDERINLQWLKHYRLPASCSLLADEHAAHSEYLEVVASVTRRMKEVLSSKAAPMPVLPLPPASSHIHIVLDTSASMEAILPSISQCIWDLVKVAHALGIQADISAFNSSVRGFTPSSTPSSEAYYQELDNFLQSLVAKGWTSTYQALTAAMQTTADAILLVTDGLPTTSPSKIAALCHDWLRKGHRVLLPVYIYDDALVQPPPRESTLPSLSSSTLHLPVPNHPATLMSWWKESGSPVVQCRHDQPVRLLASSASIAGTEFDPAVARFLLSLVSPSTHIKRNEHTTSEGRMPLSHLQMGHPPLFLLSYSEAHSNTMQAPDRSHLPLSFSFVEGQVSSAHTPSLNGHGIAKEEDGDADSLSFISLQRQDSDESASRTKSERAGEENSSTRAENQQPMGTNESEHIEEQSLQRGTSVEDADADVLVLEKEANEPVSPPMSASASDLNHSQLHRASTPDTSVPRFASLSSTRGVFPNFSLDMHAPALAEEDLRSQEAPSDGGVSGLENDSTRESGRGNDDDLGDLMQRMVGLEVFCLHPEMTGYLEGVVESVDTSSRAPAGQHEQSYITREDDVQGACVATVVLRHLPLLYRDDEAVIRNGSGDAPLMPSQRRLPSSSLSRSISSRAQRLLVPVQELIPDTRKAGEQQSSEVLYALVRAPPEESSTETDGPSFSETPPLPSFIFYPAVAVPTHRHNGASGSRVFKLFTGSLVAITRENVASVTFDEFVEASTRILRHQHQVEHNALEDSYRSFSSNIFSEGREDIDSSSDDEATNRDAHLYLDEVSSDHKSESLQYSHRPRPDDGARAKGIVKDIIFSAESRSRSPPTEEEMRALEEEQRQIERARHKKHLERERRARVHEKRRQEADARILRLQQQQHQHLASRHSPTVNTGEDGDDGATASDESLLFSHRSIQKDREKRARKLSEFREKREDALREKIEGLQIKERERRLKNERDEEAFAIQRELQDYANLKAYRQRQAFEHSSRNLAYDADTDLVTTTRSRELERRADEEDRKAAQVLKYQSRQVMLRTRRERWEASIAVSSAEERVRRNHTGRRHVPTRGSRSEQLVPPFATTAASGKIRGAQKTVQSDADLHGVKRSVASSPKKATRASQYLDLQGEKARAERVKKEVLAAVRRKQAEERMRKERAKNAQGYARQSFSAKRQPRAGNGAPSHQQRAKATQPPNLLGWTQYRHHGPGTGPMQKAEEEYFKQQQHHQQHQADKTGHSRAASRVTKSASGFRAGLPEPRVNHADHEQTASSGVRASSKANAALARDAAHIQFLQKQRAKRANVVAKMERERQQTLADARYNKTTTRARHFKGRAHEGYLVLPGDGRMIV